MSSLARSPGEVGVAKLCKNVAHAVVKVWAINKVLPKMCNTNYQKHQQRCAALRTSRSA